MDLSLLIFLSSLSLSGSQRQLEEPPPIEHLEDCYRRSSVGTEGFVGFGLRGPFGELLRLTGRR